MFRTIITLALMMSLLVAFEVGSAFAQECNSCQSCRNKAQQLRKEEISLFAKWRSLKETNQRLMMDDGKRQEILRQARIKLTECEQKIGYPGCNNLKSIFIARKAEAENSHNLFQKNNSEMERTIKDGNLKKQLADKAQKTAEELCRLEKKQ